jgi:hypothetical protein
MSEVTREQITNAIYGQESSHGKADTSQENYAGARGGMQVTKKTFEGMKSKGMIPNDFDHANNEHSMQAGRVLVGHLFDKYQGDTKKVAAAYYAGEKAVRDDGTIADFRDLKNPKAPTTLQYVADIQKRLGLQEDSKLLATQDPLKAAMPGPMEPKAGKYAGALESEAQTKTEPMLTEEQRLARATIEGMAAKQEVEDSTFIDKARASFMHNGVLGPVAKEVVRNSMEFQPTPGFVLDPKMLEKRSAEDQEYLLTAGSQREAEWIAMDIDARNEDLRTVNLSGTGVGIAATIFAGLPEAYLTGLGSAKSLQAAGWGSRALAQAGRTGAAVGSIAAENVGMNLALTSLQDVFDPYIGGTDYAMAVGMGVIGSGLNIPGTFSRGAGRSAQAAGKAIMDSATNEMMGYRTQAIKNLGAHAEPDALVNEAKRLEANEIRKNQAAGTAQLPEERRLLPDDEELRADAPEAAAADAPVGGQQFEFSRAATQPQFDNPAYIAQRVEAATNNASWQKAIGTLADGEFDYQTARNLPAGVHVTSASLEDIRLRPVQEAVQGMARKFLPDSRVILGTGSNSAAASGEIISAGNVHFVGVKPNAAGPTASVRTAMHELGHAVFHEHAVNIPTDLLNRMKTAHGDFLVALQDGKLDEAVNRRFGLTSPSREATSAGLRKAGDYAASFDEYTAEQFVKFLEKGAKEGKDVGLTPKIIKMVKDAIQAALDFFRDAKRQGYIDPDEAFGEFFQRVLDGNLKQAKQVDEFLAPDLVLPSSFDRTQQQVDFANDPAAIKHGVEMMPTQTPAQQAEAKAVLSLYKKAESPAYAKVDEKRLSKLLDTAMFEGAQSTSNTMLRSDNPVVRMVAAELLESPSGAAGRRSNAAIAKQLNEQQYLGNTLNEVQSQYVQWRNSQGGNAAGDTFGGRLWLQFNKLVAEEIESRKPGAQAVESPPAVKQAADSLEKAYERMRVAQTDAKTVGWASLPESSVGYMPHRMSGEAIQNASNSQLRALHDALRDQFISIEGFDMTFSQNLASKYLDRVRVRALGGFQAPANIHQVGAADIVEEALEQMGLTREQITAQMKRYMAGGAGHTKRRLKLDLNAEHADGAGGTFKLMDLFETDQFKLLRTQAHRVSGEVALSRHGIMGKSGLKLLRRAMEFGADRQKAQPREFDAFDQVSAEFLGDSFGTQSKLVDRVMQVNSLARLGGMGFTQFAEAINGVFHVGALRTLDSISSLGRLRSEIIKLSKGEKVDNPIIGSLEQWRGAEFGTQSYKTVFPFDNGSLQYQTFGRETLTAGDRLLRGGSFLQGKLSMWRAIHSAQQRGMAEQIVRKATQYLKDGGNDVALRDMGISDELMARMRKDLNAIAQFDGDKLTNFDITKATDLQAAEEFTQAIHRGVSQIIQGTFIGETGKWSHDGMMRLMTQFRTFSLTSIEKQWARQVGNVGVAKTLGYMMGAMSLAAPIYMARTYLSSIGREDQAAYLEKQLNPAQIARATLNYVAMSGLAGDTLDALTAVTGVGKVTGGRTGVGSEFVGNVVAPAAGLVDDVWRGLQNTKEGTDPHELLKTLPFNRVPWLVPAINALGD